MEIPVHKALVIANLAKPDADAIANDVETYLVDRGIEVETFRYRVRRYYLSGDKAGQSDIWVDRLPGFADGIKGDGSGRFYIAMGTLRRTHLEWIHHRPWIKEQLTKLPRGLWARPSHQATVLELDSDGQTTRRFDDPTGRWRMLSSVYVHKGDFYLGMLDGDAIARFVLRR